MKIIRLSEIDLYHARRVAIWNVQSLRQNRAEAIASHGSGNIVEMWQYALEKAKREATLARKMHRIWRGIKR